MGCIKPIDIGANFCPHCRYPTDSEQTAPYLSQGQIIGNRYMVGKVIFVAGDSVSYIGLDRHSGKTVTVNEYFPSKIAHRANKSSVMSPKNGYSSLYQSCLKSFLSLWRGIRMFSDVSCLPLVTDIFSANGTAYSVCEHKDCMSLKYYFEKTRKPLTSHKAIAAFIPVLNALKSLHNAGIVHGNINPSTVQVGPDGRLNLTGFTIPQCHSQIAELNSRPVPGFSPLELYDTKTAKPESDIYSITAVMFYAITGTVLPKATDRINDEAVSVPDSLPAPVPRYVLNAMNRGLAVYTYNRISRADELISALKPTNNKFEQMQKNTQTTNRQKQQNQPQPRKRAAAPPPVQPRPVAKKRVRKAEPEEEIKTPPTLAFAVTSFLSVILFVSIGFCVLYSTVLYKSIEVPFIDNILSSVTFLPMNKQSTPDEEVMATTEDFQAVTQQSYATVIDFTQLTYEEIVSNENYQRNFVFVYKMQASDTVEKGHIISQNATVNESVPVGTEIILVVSTGIEQVVVPDVKQKTEKEAREILEKAGFTVSKLLIENTGNKTPGVVYRTNISAGKSVDKGSIIVIEVWDKVPETTTAKAESTTKADSTAKADSTTKADSASTTKKAATTTTKSATTTTKAATTADED